MRYHVHTHVFDAYAKGNVRKQRGYNKNADVELVL